MITRTVSLDIMEFVEQNILPRYNAFDKAHNLGHANVVIKKSMALALSTGADINMAYVVAAYHDLGLEGPRAIHHITSGKILVADRRLRRWFSEEQIVVMKEAVEDHRASASHAPRSIYGKIVAEADRDIDVRRILRRTVQFGLSHYPGKTRDEQYKRFVHHLNQKYSEHGYIRLWLPNSPNEAPLKELRAMICDKVRLQAAFIELYDEEVGD